MIALPTKHNRKPKWHTLIEAAEFMSESANALRKRLERQAYRAPDGGIEADIDGVHGRKFGNRWRIRFSERWTQ